MTKPKPPIEALGDALTIRAKLMLLGWASLNEWGRIHGHKSGCLHITVNTWGHRTDRSPHGGLSRAVMADLRKTFEQGIRPCDYQPAAPEVKFAGNASEFIEFLDLQQAA